jgi:hypothetical protein
LDATQRNWDIYDKELYAVVHALETWRPYLVGNAHKTLINTDHNNLTYFKAARKLNRRQARWMQELAEFDFELQHVPGKKHVPADFLSRPFGENQGKDDNEDLILLPPARFALTDFPTTIEDKRRVLQAYHNHPLAGHPGCYNFPILDYGTMIDSHRTFGLLTRLCLLLLRLLLSRRFLSCTIVTH